jgi:hypothetical protein
MTRKLVKVVGLALVAGGLVPSVARADQFRTWTVCGGNAFATCASVEVTVNAANHVTMRVWNLSGFYGSYANTVFTGIGFENVGSAVGVLNSLSMTGPKRDASAQPWALKNNTQIGGGVNLDMVTTVPQGSSVNNGIASQCASSLPGGTNTLWWNPCATPAGASDPGWIVLEFDITGTWDLANSYLLVKGQSGLGSTECITGGANANCSVVPEPLSMTLLATGLAGMSGIAALRRRRRGNDVVNG